MIELFLQVLLEGQPAPAPDPATTQPIEKLQQEERVQTQTEVKGMKNLGTISVTDLVRFRLVDKLIAIDSPVQATSGDETCTLKEIPGTAIFSLMKTAPINGTSFSSLKLIHRDFSQKDTAVSQTSVFAAPRSIQLARDVEKLNEESSISLVQTPGDNGHGNIRLYVQGHNSLTGAKTLDIKIEADDLVQLRRKYPRETAVYLLPILRDLRAERTLYYTDPRAAWQILGGTYQGSPSMTAKINTLIRQLDSDSPAERAAALKALQEIGEPAAMMVMTMNRTALSPEQNSALDAFLTPYAPLSADDAKRLGNDPDFLLDCLMADDAVLRNRALQRLRAVLNKKIDFDPNADESTRSAMVMKIREDLPAATTQTSEPQG